MTKSITERSKLSLEFRKFIAERDRNALHDKHVPNGDEEHYEQHGLSGIMSFTKGLGHNEFGQVDPNHFQKFRAAIDEGKISNFNCLTPPSTKTRKWEAPTAGFVMDPQGPDSQARTMPPAPAMNPKDGTFDELVFELAEVYELALLRDQPLADFANGAVNPTVSSSVTRLSKLAYAQSESPFSGRPRKTLKGKLTTGTVFRGFGDGVEAGSYLSCFLLMGSGDVTSGQINYGNQIVDQRVREALPQDYMITQGDWLEPTTIF